MGREVRHVPQDWVHPKAANGRYIPLLDDYPRAVEDWKMDLLKIANDCASSSATGIQRQIDRLRDHLDCCPRPESYMPEFPKEMCTHLQMYETTSEGTPISPVMRTPEELARWLADNKTSSFADMTATCEQWLDMIHDGWAPSMAVIGGQTISGVAAMEKK